MTMADDFDRAMAELQEQVIQEARSYFSAKVVEEVYHPQNMGLMMDPDGCGSVLGLCGDTMEIYLRLHGRQIFKAAFITDGCGVTVACGSKVTQMAEGLSLEEATAITPEELIAALDGLPEEHVHCAVLAVETLREAIADCGREGNQPGGTLENENKTRGG
jgi:nitrogen fixation NifU-like protein